MNFSRFKRIIGRILEICADFVILYKRYFAAALVFICMILVVFLGTKTEGGTNTTGDKAHAGVYKDFKVDKYPDVSALIKDYYEAYASGDTDKIQLLADPVSDQEISYIKFYSEYIEKFDVVNVYTKQGLTDNEYLVNAKVYLKYNNIDTAAPGLDFFYVRTGEDGKLYIDNKYGSFNQNNNIYEMETDVSDLIAVFIRQQDLLDMEAEVQDEFTKALESDNGLNTLISESLPGAVNQWHADYDAQVAAEEEAAKKAEEEAAAAAAEAAEAQAQADEEANAVVGKTTTKANVRETADANSNKLGSLAKGTEIKIYTAEGDFYKFDYEGKRAYISKDLVKIVSENAGDTAEETEENTNTGAAIAEGTEITIKSTTNIRSQMDSSSSKVAVAYEGEKVTVIMSYAEGWTKVKYGKKEGFIRTDLLQQ